MKACKRKPPNSSKLFYKKNAIILGNMTALEFINPDCLTQPIPSIILNYSSTKRLN